MWSRLVIVGTLIGCSGKAPPDGGLTADQALEIPREPLELSVQVPVGAIAPRADGGPLSRFMDYGATIDRVTGMVSDDGLIERATLRGLDVLDLTWEDTGREMGSAVGPNISDLTLQVRRKSPWVAGAYVTSLMPVIRFPNFTDKTGDVPADKFFVRVGNEKDGGDLSSIPLTELLKSITEHASAPKSIKGSGNLLAPRDTHFLVSAQAVFLPIPKYGEAEFNPVLFNYQSAPGSPADLAILVTRQGTSVQVIENKPEDRTSTGWGQELYFDNRGQRANFTAERRTEVMARIEAQGGPQSDDDRTAMSKAADVIFLIQVPLKHKNDGYLNGLSLSGSGFGAGGLALVPMAAAAPTASQDLQREVARSDVDRAVVGHGPNLGPFSEGHDLELVRDPTFPVRITVQFYKATSNGVVSNADLDAIRKSIADVYSHADFVGSLVVPEDDAARPTAWEKSKGEWFPW